MTWSSRKDILVKQSDCRSRPVWPGGAEELQSVGRCGCWEGRTGADHSCSAHGAFIAHQEVFGIISGVAMAIVLRGGGRGNENVLRPRRAEEEFFSSPRRSKAIEGITMAWTRRAEREKNAARRRSVSVCIQFSGAAQVNGTLLAVLCPVSCLREPFLCILDICLGSPFLPSPSLLIISISSPIKAPSQLLVTRWFDVN